MSQKEEMETVDGADEVDDYEVKMRFVNSIAKPMASKKLTKRLYKCIKKASTHKTYVRQGLKEVQKHIRRGEKGFVVFAGDVNPLDTYSHMPVVCEEANVPYCFVPSKLDLGRSIGSKKSACVVLVKTNADYKDVYDKCCENIKAIPAAL